MSENPPYVIFANVFPAVDHVTLCTRLHSLFVGSEKNKIKNQNKHFPFINSLRIDFVHGKWQHMNGQNGFVNMKYDI